MDPFFSPDGTKIAFTGQYDGNVDAYVIPAEGGSPQRLTAHPGSDVVIGWNPKGTGVLVRSPMLSNTDYDRAFEVPLSGGIPKALPFPAVNEASMSPDGTKVAYIANGRWQEAWKRYRGGQAGAIWIAQMSDSKWRPLPKTDTDDRSPMWIGDSVYFLSDPTGPMGLHRYDTTTGKTLVVIPGSGFDIKSATAGSDVIAYEKLGSIHLYDLETKTSKQIPISIKSDFPEVRVGFKNVAGGLTNLAVSPSGSRLVASARGYVFTVPASKGDARLLDDTQGLNRDGAVWSPDGKTIAYVTDRDGGEKLALWDVSTGSETRFALAGAPGVYSGLVWSPDSKRILNQSEKLGLYSFDLTTKESLTIDKQLFRGRAEMKPSWSPDSQWVAYSRDLLNHLNAVFLYNFKSGKSTQVTDGLSDATSPVFDLNGKHLYFLASTDAGSSTSFENMSANIVPNSTASVYAMVLRSSLPNPLEPESDEESAGVKKPDEKAEPFSIDLEGIEDRIVALPMPRQIYRGLVPGKAGSFFALTSPPRATVNDFGGPGALVKFNFTTRTATPFASGVSTAQPTPSGDKILLQLRGGFQLVGSDAPPAPGQGAVSLSGLSVKIDPRTEWRAMYHEVWRKERLLFYDANLHGVDTQLLEKRFEPFLTNIVCRDDLNYLFTDMLGELCVGHMFIGGGDMPTTQSIPGGLLGGDFSFEGGRYRLERVYSGERWNPSLIGPLAQPGVNAKRGEYILAINGQELNEAKDIYLLLEGKAGKQVQLKLGPNADGSGSRTVTVVPIASEKDLRFRAWSEDNRKAVAKLTDGKIGYVHIPDTGGGGWREFQRYYYAQGDKSGMVVDDRFNHGGSVNDFMVFEMQKPLDFFDISRYGGIIRDPVNGVYGPKVMLINEMAGSGGDIFPYIFKKRQVGKLVGRRTWGAQISAYGFSVIDGGSVRAPDDAMVDVATGDWIIENYGTPPDIAVELDPYLWRQGRDSQLEAAVTQVLKELETYKSVPAIRPKYPNKTRVKGSG
jgi:tricorn protease